MIIKINKCSAKEKTDITYWYRDLIGKMFQVEWDTFGYYFVKWENKANFVNKKDV